jgi:hypothetical protein
MTSYRLGGALLAASILLTTVLAGTATAGTTTNDTADHKRSTLTLAVDGPRGLYTVRLKCHPSGGSHPNPSEACREVAIAGGDFDNLPGDPAMTACTMEYRPVMATARGRWHGEPVNWQHEYSNPCSLLAATGVVFDF